MLVGVAMLGTLLREREVKLLSPDLDPAKSLPQTLDYFGLRFEIPRAA